MVDDLRDCPESAISAEQSRRHHLHFMQHMWQRKDPFIIGIHTRQICERIDQAIIDFDNGKSTFLAIKCPFRHGKSDIVSRYLPANFIGKYPDQGVIVAAYSSTLARSFSRFSRSIVRDERFKEIYSNVELSKEKQSIEEWGIVDRDTGTDIGEVNWLGIGASVTGKGGSLILIDDFCKGRQEAESETMRNAVWESITNDVLTRRAPVSIVIILATPWHMDDVFGRIERKMQEDPKFPYFEELKFPAFDDKYPTGTLFPERFTMEWYESESATLGQYGTAALLQCSPVLREGNVFHVDNIKYVDSCPSDIPYTIGWDLASTEKQRMSDDPDYTVGIKLGLFKDDRDVPSIYIDYMKRGRWDAPERDHIIRNTCTNLGYLTVAVESFGGYKDVYNTLKRILLGKRVVKKLNLPGDKLAKAQALEPLFEAGNVYIRKGDWNKALIEELTNFPGGRHDDIVDALIVAYQAHDPDKVHVWDKYNPKAIMSNFAINFSGLQEHSTLICSQWVDSNLKTYCLLGMWNAKAVKLYIFGEVVFDTPQPETVLTGLSRTVKAISRGVITNMKKFEWFGNDLMFSKKMAADLQYGYRKYNCFVRDNENFDGYGSAQMVSRLIHRKGLVIQERCMELNRQMGAWAINDNKPDEDFYMCLALCNMVSALYEYGKTALPKPMSPYSKAKTKFWENALKAEQEGGFESMTDDEFEEIGDSEEGGKYGWM